jgi:hypothetical protein
VWKAIPLTLATLLLRRALAQIVKSGSLTLLQIARRQEAAPLTRDYIAAAEAELRRREAELAAPDAGSQRRRSTTAPRTGSALTGA